MKAIHLYRRLNASDYICWKWIRLCHYFWSICEIKSCCLFLLQIVSLLPLTNKVALKKTPKIVLEDSYQHLHSRALMKREINTSPSLVLSLSLSQACTQPRSLCICLVSRADVLVCPWCHHPGQNPLMPTLLSWATSDLYSTIFVCSVVIVVLQMTEVLACVLVWGSSKGQGFRVLKV